jgi:RNA polymerase sigma-70 factor (ECF subfamily)
MDALAALPRVERTSRPRVPASRASGSVRVTERDQATVDRLKREEVQLLYRIRDKDEAAVAELYSRYSGPLYSLAYQVTRAERFAQEVVQEVFFAVWREASRFDPQRGAVSSWLFTLARHKAIDLVRKEANVARRQAPEAALETRQSEHDVDHEAWLNIRRDRVQQAVSQLPEAQRTCVELAFFRGLTHVEVAEELAIPLGTAKTRIRTGLLRLRDLLGDSLSEAQQGSERWITQASES